MLESLHIRNFQSHKDSNLDFVPGVNLIIGETDSGKTSILRALRWLIWNRPGGEAFRSHWGGDTEVTLITTEGNAITRAKNKENLYQLNDTIFKAFGTEIPREIAEVLNITEINFQRQFDMPFMLTATPGEVAAHFNKIAHIEKIDTATKKVQAWAREIEQTIKSDERQLGKFQEKLEQYAYLDKMESELEVLEQLEKDFIQTINSHRKLVDYYDSLLSIEQDIEDLSWWFEMESDIDALLLLYDFLKEIEKDSKALKKIVNEVDLIETKTASSIAIIYLEPLLLPILNQYQEIADIEKEKEKLALLIQRIETVKAHINVGEKLEIPNLQAMFDEGMGDTCILCEQKINHKH